MDTSKKKRWAWWYPNCFAQNAYMVLAVLVGLVLAVLIVLLAIGVKLPIDDKDPEQKLILAAISKYKVQLIIALILSFFVTLIIDNFILVWYCGTGTKGVMNVIMTLLLWFVILPFINGIISSIIMYFLLLPLINELNKIKKEYEIMKLQAANAIEEDLLPPGALPPNI